MRILRGIRSFIFKLLSIDLRVASYMFFGPPKPPRSTYFFGAMTITSLIVSLVRNPTAGLAIVLVALLLLTIALYTMAQAPPLRWHFLRDTISVRYDDESDRRITYTESIHARSLLKMCATVRYPISHSGNLDVLEVRQDGNLIQAKIEGSGGPGYYVLRYGMGLAAAVVDLPRHVPFGGETTITIQWRLEDAAEDHQEFTVNTLVDRVTFNMCFYRTRYPVGIRVFEEFGVRQRDLQFIPQRRAEDAEHICETWDPESVEFLHKYIVRWILPPRPAH